MFIWKHTQLHQSYLAPFQRYNGRDRSAVQAAPKRNNNNHQGS